MLNNELNVICGSGNSGIFHYPVIQTSTYDIHKDKLRTIFERLGIDISYGIVWCSYIDKIDHNLMVNVTFSITYYNEIKMSLPTVGVNNQTYYMNTTGAISTTNYNSNINNFSMVYPTLTNTLRSDIYLPTSFGVLVNFIKVHKPEIYDMVKKLLYSNDESNYIIACEMVCNAFNIKLEEDVCNKA